MRPLSALAVVLGVVGGVTDIYSGAIYPSGQMGPSAYSVAFYILGAVVIATSLAMLTPMMRGRMSGSAALMEIYGIIMVLASGYIPMMEAGASDAMFIFGALMIVDGALIQYRSRAPMATS
jgi:hypothetical protein